MIKNETKMFKYRKNVFQREIKKILTNEERQDLNYNLKFIDEAFENTI